MLSIPLLVLLINAVWSDDQNEYAELHSQKMIELINNRHDIHWSAAPSKRFSTDMEMKLQLGTWLNAERELLNIPVKQFTSSNIKLPKHFDAREKWPNCTIISHIPDQSSCGSCWAVASASAMSDRLCIHSETHNNLHISARNLMSSCYKCGRGCRGGYMWEAFRYWAQSGIVTGGPHECKTGCQPYPYPKCSRSVGSYPLCAPYSYQTPDALMGCQYNYKTPYDMDKTYGTSYYILPNNETAIMEEIITNGPVVPGYTVYEDFRLYDRGIYEHVTGKALGGHAVRIIGWGEENGKKYWLIANSWNDQWGEDGYFRMIRGKNDCGIEDYVVAGMPKV